LLIELLSIPAALMPLARNNNIGLTLYGGAILVGKTKKQSSINISTNYEAVGAYASGKMTKEDLKEIEQCSCPTIGACPGMFTANTMATGNTNCFINSCIHFKLDSN
jgi:dihydroxy-acid dehydratase